ncbi:MAG: PAS domain-containing sensor histidine kinase [Ignavibacteriaceae bacterium]
MRKLKKYLTALAARVRSLIVSPWYEKNWVSNFPDRSGNLVVIFFRILVLIPLLLLIEVQYSIIFSPTNTKSFTQIKITSFNLSNLNKQSTISSGFIDTSGIKITINSNPEGKQFLRLSMKPGSNNSKAIMVPVDDSIPSNACLKIKCRSSERQTYCRIDIFQCMSGDFFQDGGDYFIYTTIPDKLTDLSIPLKLFNRSKINSAESKTVNFNPRVFLHNIKLTFYPNVNSVVDIHEIKFEEDAYNIPEIILFLIIMIVGVILFLKTSLRNQKLSTALDLSSPLITSRTVFFLAAIAAFRASFTNSFPFDHYEIYFIFGLFLLIICIDEFYTGILSRQTFWSLRYFLVIIAVWLSGFTDNAIILAPLTLAVFIPVIQQKRRLIFLFAIAGMLLLFIIINNFKYFIPEVTGLLIIVGTSFTAAVMKEIFFYELLKSDTNFAKFLYENLFENSYDGIYTTDNQGVIITANYGFGNMLGYPIQETIGKNIFDFVVKEDHHLLNHLMEETVSKKLNMCDINFRDAANSIHTILIRLVAIYKNNVITGYQSIATDITERKLNELELRESKSRYKALLNAIPDIVLKFTHDGILLDFHNVVSHDSGIKFENLLGKSIDSIFDPVITQSFLLHAENAFRKNRPQIFEYKSMVNGEVIYEEARIVSIQDDNFIVIIRDITVRKQAESKIQKYLIELDNNRQTLEKNAKELADLNSKLEEINKNKDKLFSIIAHDLRSPFTGLLGFANILSNQYESLSTDEIKNYLGQLNHSLMYVFKLLENLLDWSRMQTGKITFAPKCFNLELLIHRIVGIFQINASEKKINIEIRVSPFNSVFADEDMIDITIRNLLSNAIKFTRPGGKICIDTSLKNGMIEITLSDNGIGILPENLSKLFRIDENISTDGTARERGTGLGLLLCKEFIEKNGGNIEVVSKINEGSKFKFTLPISE